VQRAEQAGLVTTRKVGNTRLVRANTASPYYAGLADVLTRAFGVPAVLAEALRHVKGVDEPTSTDHGRRREARPISLSASAARSLPSKLSKRPRSIRN
jgi:hypothetical protein